MKRLKRLFTLLFLLCTTVASAQYYTLTYMVDGKNYATYYLAEGDEIPTPSVPTKYEHVFVGWNV